MLDKIASQSPRYRRYERYVAIVCPFHDDHEPSLLAWDDGFFSCMGCGRKGSNKELIAKLSGVDNIGQEETSVKRGLPLPRNKAEQHSLCWRSHNLLLKDEIKQYYLEKRGVISRLEPNTLGWWKGWYTIPITGYRRDFDGMVCRADPHTQSTKGLRFCMPAGQKPQAFFPNPETVRQAGKVYIVFGIFDALALSTLGYPSVTSSGSKDTFQANWVEEVEEVYIVPDEGEFESADDLAMDIGFKARIVDLEYNGAKDPCEYIEQGREEELHEAFAT